MLSHFNIVITLFIATVDVHDASVSERNTPELKLVSVVRAHFYSLLKVVCKAENFEAAES